MTDDLIESLRLMAACDDPDEIADHAPGYLITAADRIATQQEAIDELVAHIREQSTHCQTRIQDGIEMGDTIWRLALEDVARENAAILSKHGERT